MAKTNKQLKEELLTEDEERFVMFPVKHDDIWQMYKKEDLNR